MGVTRIVSETVGVHHTCIVELLTSSTSDALELESRSIIVVLRFSELIGTVSSLSPDPPQVRSLDPLS